jgi:hypothetical protein
LALPVTLSKKPVWSRRNAAHRSSPVPVRIVDTKRGSDVQPAETRERSLAALHPDLSAYRRQLAEITSQASRLVDGLREDQLRFRPQPDAWSIIECIDHLTTVARLYLGRLDGVITRARKVGRLSDGPYRHGWLGDFMVRSMEPPVKRRFKAPAAFRPSAKIASPPAIVSQFFEVHEGLGERIDKANGLDLGRVKIASPASGLIRLSLGQCFALLLAHDRRHLWQANNVRSAANFPP